MTGHKKEAGEDIYTLIRSCKKLKKKYVKTILDIKFLKQCKQKQLIPTFANVCLSMKGCNIKLKYRIAHIIIEDELDQGPAIDVEHAREIYPT